MTVHVLFAEPPRVGRTLPGLVEAGQLDAEEAKALAEAMVKDTAAAVAASGGDLLINYPPEVEGGGSDADPETELQALIEDVYSDPESVRYEPQVGASATARIENACRHLLEEEDTASVAILDGRAPILDRTDLDGASMKLRRSEMVVGPAPNGRVSYLGLSEPVELEGLNWPFHLGPLVERAAAEGLDIDFLELHPWVGDREGLQTVISLIGARRSADRRVPEHTAVAIESLRH
ncbi:MAG: DUF2064 domain-containing protein [Halobacteriales archaeon]